MTVQVVEGNCREVMAGMAEASVSAVVTDPPYLLGFMNKTWDSGSVTYEIATWQAAFRVLKPGGHLVAFGGTRTFHRLACAIEDAGFEIRDCLSWLYGSGFPKSLDVSKAIDKQAGAEREVIGRSAHASGIADGNAGPQSRETDFAWARGKAVAAHYPITAPATPEAQQWQGWGTALKPAMELICLARKPLSESNVAGNVLAHGTGALNIDATRIGMGESDRAVVDQRSGAGVNKDVYGAGMGREDGRFTSAPAGRWPANVVLDDEAARMLDEQSGERPSPWIGNAAGHEHGSKGGLMFGGSEQRIDTKPEYGDTGGASRFFGTFNGRDGEPSAQRRYTEAGGTNFAPLPGRRREVEMPSRFYYTAKASSSERNERLKQTGQRNLHPTVKPVDLMRWLIRLVTPPGGTILDPFCGSGSTLVAALLEGVEAIGIELEPSYVQMARARIDGIQMGGLLQFESFSDSASPTSPAVDLTYDPATNPF